MNYDRIILELMDRVASLEDEVSNLKSQIGQSITQDDSESTDNSTAIYTSTGRDTTKYILDGQRYGKNRLVLAIVKKYMQEHPNTSADQLLTVFHRSLQGSLGVVRKLEEVKNSYSDYERRFFVSQNEVINTTTDVCVVCSQWGIMNIGNIVTRAKQLGIEITAV